jgi:hypothetical protein
MNNGNGKQAFDFGNVEDWATDAEIVKNGAPFDAGRDRVLMVRRAGGANRRLMTALAALNPNDEHAFHECYARLVVTGWSGFLDRQGAPIPYSTEACTALFAQCPELFFALLLFSNDRANYRQAAHTEDQDAVKPPSGGSEAQAPTSSN